MPTYPEFREIGGVKYPVWTSYSGVKSAAMNCITEEPYDCEKCGTCCFSTISTVSWEYEITSTTPAGGTFWPDGPSQTIFENCARMYSGSVTDAARVLPASGTTIEWDTPDAMDEIGGAATPARYTCATNRWSFYWSFKAWGRYVDDEFEYSCGPDEPAGEGWEIYQFAFFVETPSNDNSAGDCCGFSFTGGIVYLDYTPPGGGGTRIHFTADASLTVSNNKCCLNAEEECEEEFPADCDGECNPV